MGARDGGVRERTVALAVIGVAIGSMVACATSPTMEPVSATDVVRDVRVDQDGDGRVITLIGLGDVGYTSFATSEPDAVVIDLKGVRVDGNATRVPVIHDSMASPPQAPWLDCSRPCSRLLKRYREKVGTVHVFPRGRKTGPELSCLSVGIRGGIGGWKDGA